MLRHTIKLPDSKNNTSRSWALLAQTASKFKSRILIEQDAKVVNAKSLMGVLSLTSGNLSSVTFVLNGEDEREAYAEISRLLSGSFFKAV
ncbi:MAG: HPr family phosphocarrier protein [Oscillospiraceae bacterium]|jgi:phosphotransferase system HPr (HPr) family protein|nr:HPr family phosphocarrier protein [Oscillospiraceae bacterium]